MKKRLPLLFLVVPLAAGALYLRSLASWRPKRVFAGKGVVSGLTYSRDGKTLLVVQSLPHTDSSTTVSALDSQNSFVPRWRKENMVYIDNHPQFFVGDSSVLLSTNEAMIGLDVITGQVRRNYQNVTASRVTISPDGHWLAYCGMDASDGKRDGRVFVVTSAIPTSFARFKVKARILSNTDQYANALAFSPDGLLLVIGVGNRSGAHLEFYDTQTWKRIKTLDDEKRSPSSIPLIHDTLRWSSDGRLLLSSWCRSSHSLVRSGTRLWQVQDGKMLAYSSYIWLNSPQLRLENDGSLLALKFPGDVVRLKNLKHVTPQVLLHLPTEQVTTIALSPDESYLVAGTQSGKVYRQRLK